MKVGYQRVSSEGQNLDRQELGPDVERIFAEKVSAKNADRAALQQMIAFVREGDEVVVFSIDRLARDLRDLQSIIQTLNDKGVRFHSSRNDLRLVQMPKMPLRSCSFS